jgi:isoquinoline 1-oxidoreductase subunit beta
MSMHTRLKKYYRQLQNKDDQQHPPTNLDSQTDNASTIARRDFIRNSMLASGGLVLALTSNGKIVAAGRTGGEVIAAEFAPNAFVRISPDNTVTVIAMHDEMGQGIHTGLAMAICEELEIDTDKVIVEPAPSDAKYAHSVFGIQMTGGSSSTYTSLESMRKAGATAREMLRAAAAKQWSIDVNQCLAKNGSIENRQSGKKFTYGELASAAAELDVPADVKLKDPKNFTRIGKPTHRVDSPAKVRGTALFSFDQKADGMLTALIQRSSYFGGKLIEFDDTDASEVPGVIAFAEVPAGVAVIAKGYWPAFKARKKLKIKWDAGRGIVMDSADLWNQFRTMAKQPGAVADAKGDFNQTFSNSDDTLELVYEAPYQAHAPMEPLSCLVTLLPDGGAKLVTGSQFLGADRGAVAQRLGVDPSKVTIENSYLGGGFGRRANPASDFLIQAVDVALAAKDLNAPIKTVWSREDDIQGGWYRPMYVNAMAASFNNGSIDAWRHRIVGQSIAAGTAFAATMVQNGIDQTSIEGAAHLPFAIENYQVELHTIDLPVPVQWWRSVGHSNTAFAKESFVDECAVHLKRDPYELRKELLKNHSRLLRVLNVVAEKAAWQNPLPRGVGRGIAVHESFESFVGHVVEASVENGKPKIHRIVCAVDCGPVVNPDQVAAQLEGAAMYGLSATLEGEITFKDGLVQQSNFHDFPIVRMNEAPKVEVHIIPSTESMGGIGEVGVPGIASAVCSAIFNACGKRIRRLPIGDQLA